MQKKTLAAIDIGSNAIRLLINYIDGENGNVDFKKAAYVRVPIRLGEDVFTQGYIGEAKKAKLCEAMQAFLHLMKTFNTQGYRVCATSAMREAANGQQVIDAVKACSNMDIEIISGEEEAETIYAAGGFSDLLDKNKSYLYVDVGGGSTEVVVYSSHRNVDSRSFKLGTVRILSNAVDDNEWNDFSEWLQNIAAQYKPVAIVGSGGNINKVHKLLGKKEKESLSYAEIKSLYNHLKVLGYEDRMVKMKLNDYRADVIVPALKIFVTVCKVCNIDKTIVPRVGLADGIIHKLANL